MRFPHDHGKLLCNAAKINCACTSQYMPVAHEISNRLNSVFVKFLGALLEALRKHFSEFVWLMLYCQLCRANQFTSYIRDKRIASYLKSFVGPKQRKRKTDG